MFSHNAATGASLGIRMKVMAFATLSLLGLLALPGHVCAQPAHGTHRIAFVNSGPASHNAPNLAAFRAGLAELGYVEGRNLIIDVRWGDQKVERVPGLVGEVLAQKPAIIVSTGGPITVRAAKAVAASVPIVFITGDPIAEKIVPSLARPGGNATGLAVLSGELEAKRLEVLTQLAPGARKIAMIWNPMPPYVEGYVQTVEAAARQLGVTLTTWKARDPAELGRVLNEIANSDMDAMFVISDPMLGNERTRIIEFANRQRLPGMYFWREFAMEGGLASYGASLTSLYRRAATYVDRILKGARPGDLPVEQPTTFELVINRDAAKAIGITIPQAVLIRAEVIP